jgi:hypothetical protein
MTAASQFQPGLVVVGRADPSSVVLHLGTTAAPTQKAPVCVILPERRAALQAYAKMENMGGQNG